MSFGGTRFEKLENSIKHEISRKRKGITAADAKDDRKRETKKTKIEPKKVPTKSELNSESKQHTNPPPIGKGSQGKSSHPLPAGSEDFINNRTVYVQGLPFTATEEDVRAFFKEVGEITSVRLPKWHDSGNLKGYGHIEFRRADSATKALDLNGEYLKDRYLTIDRPQVPRSLANAETREPTAKPAGCRTIFIKNLPYETNEAEITEAFKVYGPIKSVRLAVWNHTGKLKGIGYVDFKREDSAETAVKKSGTLAIQGRKTVVDYETGIPKGSFKKKED